jgi:EmrB/QacA subfamily drug resistance transporter
MDTLSAPAVRFGTAEGRWVIAAAVLGSGIAFLDSTVVNVALPAMRADLHLSVTGLQWTVDAYLVTLSALLLFGGSLGDVVGLRRVFVAGLVGFVVASLFCGLAPSSGVLIAARALQGAAAAFLVPGSLAIVSATFHPDDRNRAVGAWSGLAGVASAIGPLLGGWLIDAVSWRLIFLINLPLAAIAAWIALRHVPETRLDGVRRPDVAGAAAVTVGLAGVTYALIEGPGGGVLAVMLGLAGVFALVAFVAIESRALDPMLPVSLFKSRQFNGANLTTFAVYAGLGGALFFVVLQLQLTLGYSAIQAGASLLPVTLLMLAFSSRVGVLAQRIGPRIPMTVGPIVAAIGLALLAQVQPGSRYLATVLPAVVVFGAGVTLTVAPLTAAVLAAVDEGHLGAGSGVNNAVARLAGLVAVAALPSLAGIEAGSVDTFAEGYPTAMRICAGVCGLGGLIAWTTIREKATVSLAPHPSLMQSCQHLDAAKPHNSELFR